MQLWRRCAKDIWKSALPLSAKLELLLLYFGIRKFATHWVSLGFFCTIVPLSVFTPEVSPDQCLATAISCMFLSDATVHSVSAPWAACSADILD